MKDMMGYSLKQALKAMCGVNQWSYAVFWKFGCHNPRLLIWEECYYLEVLPNSTVSPGLSSRKIESFHNGVQVGDHVRLLVDEMMMSKEVNFVGEGLIGRAAFTGSHQWIVSGNYEENAHPSEVLNEIRLQFSAGMQTIAVIPVIPHGVVQLASPLPILEDIGFVHDVKSLILQLGCFPSAFISEPCVLNNASSMYWLSDVATSSHNLHGNQLQMNPSPVFTDCLSLPISSSQNVRLTSHSSDSLLGQFEDHLQVNGTTFLTSYPTQDLNKSHGVHHISNTVGNIFPSPSGLIENKVDGDNVLPLKPNSMIDTNDQRGQFLKKCNQTHMAVHDAESSIKGSVGCLNMGIKLNNGLLGHGNWSEDVGYTAQHNLAEVHEVLERHPKIQRYMSSAKFTPTESCSGSQISSLKDSVLEGAFFPSSTGDDLFDVVGVDIKNKLLNENDTELHHKIGANTNEQSKDFPGSMNRQNLGIEAYAGYCEPISGSRMLSSSGPDYLLDAIISGVSSAASGRQMSDDDMSCKTTLSKISNSSVLSTPYNNNSMSDPVNMYDQKKGQSGGFSKTLMSVGESASTSNRSACAKNDGGSSRTNSAYGSQMSSWIEQGPSVGISTVNLKKPEVGKTNRKRLKPGENPRPRPKDRQMIQDRVKELRELVPNGAKCSIDALLERTVKHMLFLQCVTKHADKLKQTIESKIMDEEGGMLLKDNFEGGATWAFELGSHSMVCPIVVEDLSPPRQLLIELRCEHRGFFLEIADIIRGLGLTILKGVVEARNDKLWARFAVEANRDITRMEVFISLVHVLGPNLNGGIASVNGITDETMKAHPISAGAN